MRAAIAERLALLRARYGPNDGKPAKALLELVKSVYEGAHTF
jgi:hypothetical protein